MKRLAFVLLFFALCGCATSPLTLNPKTTENIHKIALITSPIKEEFQVLNHLLSIYGPTPTHHLQAQIRRYLPYSRRIGDDDASPGLVWQYAFKYDSLEGSPKILKEKLELFPIKRHIDDFLIEQISKRYQIADSSYFDNILQGSTGKIKNIDQYISHCKEIDVDALLTVDFFYGLAAYTGEKASAAIDSLLTVYDVKTEEKLFEDVIFSDLYFKEGFSVDDYAADDAKIFKENIVKAARGLSLLIGYEFGIDVEYVDTTKRKLPVDAVRVSCKKPYFLEQDCSVLKHAKRQIVINDYWCNIAASHDGTVILIKTPAHVSEATEEELASQTSFLTQKANNTCFELISGELSNHNIAILNKIEIKSYALYYPETAGYFLELDGDGYSILKRYTKMN